VVKHYTCVWCAVGDCVHEVKDVPCVDNGFVHDKVGVASTCVAGHGDTVEHSGAVVWLASTPNEDLKVRAGIDTARELAS
jgi:hypothetical protein